MAKAITLNDEPGEDAGELAAQCADLPEPVPTDWLAQANRFLCPVGGPGRGGILMRKSRLDRLDLAGKLRLYMHDGMDGEVTLQNVRALGNPRCVLPGPADPVYLVQLADRRVDALTWTAKRYQWRYNPTDASPSPNTATQDTWSAVLADLWPSVMGAAPSFPTGTPTPTARVIDRLDAHGFRQWDAVEDAAAALGCGVAYDPIADTTALVYFPAAPDKALGVFARYLGRLEYDESPYNPPAAAGVVPAMVVVMFPVWMPGRSDRESRLVYCVPAPPRSGIGYAPGVVQSDGIVYLQDFTPARCLNNGVATNRTLLGDRAAQVGAAYFDRFGREAPQWPIARAYRGLIDDPDVRPGASFDLVGWVLDPKPMTVLARSGLTAATELYEPPELTGLQPAPAPTPRTNADGVPVRAGGYPPELERERDAWGWAGHAGGLVSIAGAGLGPLMRRGAAIRQGEWAGIGTGARTDQRARLWRNWEDAGPDDMVRFVIVTGDARSVTPRNGGSSFLAYPCRPLRQEGDPPNWAEEENGYVAGANGETLAANRSYIARAGDHATDNKRLWATYCCSGGTGVAGSHRSQGDGLNPTPPTGDDDSVIATQPGGPEDLEGTPCAGCKYRKLPQVWFVTVPGVGTCALIYNRYYTRYFGCLPIPGSIHSIDCHPTPPGPDPCTTFSNNTICFATGQAAGFGPLGGVTIPSPFCALSGYIGRFYLRTNCPPLPLAPLCQPWIPTCLGACVLDPDTGSFAGGQPIYPVGGGVTQSCAPFRSAGATLTIPAGDTSFPGGVTFAGIILWE